MICRWFMAFAIAALSLCFGPHAAAQNAASLPVQREELKKLEWMVGQWKGEGSYEISPGKKESFSVTETIQSRLGGIAYLVEGIGKRKIPGREEEVTVHDALAIIYYDDSSKRLKFQTHIALGRHGEFDIKTLEGGWQWGTEFPGGSIRYTVKLTDKGEWHEIGERTQDKTTWRQFHEMKLSRVK